MKQLIEKEKFEIHLTGDVDIIRYLKEIGKDYLQIDMLDKELNVIGTDYMSAIKKEFSDYDEARQYASMMYHVMVNHGNLKLFRLKIESPPIEKYMNKAVYIERHWEVKKNNNEYPLSFIVNKDKYVATERCYDKKFFNEFSEKYDKTEICLLDTNVNHDLYWFNKWN